MSGHRGSASDAAMVDPVKIKICGIRDGTGADAAARCGVDAVGFVFAESPRRVAPLEARRIAGDLPPTIERIAVFRLARADEIRRVLEAFPADRVQVEPGRGLPGAVRGVPLLAVLHDDGTLAEQSAAVPPGGPVVLEGAGRGGRGVRPDWRRAAALARARPVMLAGGLDPFNVGRAIRFVRPWGVDVSSGVEVSPGRKSPARIAAFTAAVRSLALEVS